MAAAPRGRAPLAQPSPRPHGEGPKHGGSQTPPLLSPTLPGAHRRVARKTAGIPTLETQTKIKTRDRTSQSGVRLTQNPKPLSLLVSVGNTRPGVLSFCVVLRQLRRPPAPTGRPRAA